MALLDEAWVLCQISNAKMQKVAKVNHGVKVIEALFSWANDDGKRLSKGEAIHILQARFGYSDIIANQAWKDPFLSKWKKPGVPKDIEKIKVSEINGIINGEGVELPNLNYLD